MNSTPIRIWAMVVITLCAAVIAWSFHKPLSVALTTPAPSLTAIPTTVPSPLVLILTPSSTVMPSIKTASGNIRVDYLKKQVSTSPAISAVLTSLLTDKRLVVYPVRVVAYKEPDWPLIEQKLYAPTMLQEGRDYITLHQTLFDKAQQDYGVPKEALAGLIAIETEFGKNMGRYPVFSILYSRMLKWPAATWQAQAGQLVALVTYCAQYQVDCYSIKGSYAGAFGIVQFMPNSLLAYGVDGDGNGAIDLSAPADAIPSAANFLAKHGWATDPFTALARYYGSTTGYPAIVLAYAAKL